MGGWPASRADRALALPEVTGLTPLQRSAGLRASGCHAEMPVSDFWLPLVILLPIDIG